VLVDTYGWVLFTDPERAGQAKAVLEAEEYHAELQPQEDGAVIVLAIPQGTPLSQETLRKRLLVLASDLGGEFLGDGGSEQVVLRRHF
jgi:hypothetical protein